TSNMWTHIGTMNLLRVSSSPPGERAGVRGNMTSASTMTSLGSEAHDALKLRGNLSQKLTVTHNLPGRIVQSQDCVLLPDQYISQVLLLPLTERRRSAGFQPAVSRVSNPLTLPATRIPCRLEVGDTAGWKPALRSRRCWCV